MVTYLLQICILYPVNLSPFYLYKLREWSIIIEGLWEGEIMWKKLQCKGGRRNNIALKRVCEKVLFWGLPTNAAATCEEGKKNVFGLRGSCCLPL